MIILISILTGAAWRRWLGQDDYHTWPWFGRTRSRVWQVIIGLSAAALVCSAAAWSAWGIPFGLAAVGWLTAPSEYSVRQVHKLTHRLPLPNLPLWIHAGDGNPATWAWAELVTGGLIWGAAAALAVLVV